LNDPTSSAEVIPASLSAKQVIAKVKKIHATCGLGCATPLARLDPDTQSWKMLEGIFPSVEQPSLPILPPSGMTQNGTLLARKVSARTTVETEYSLWPTPTTQEVEHPEMVLTPTGRRLSKDGKTSHSVGLADLATMWPTPQANSWGATGHRQMLQKHQDSGSISQDEKLGMQAGNGGKLNPTWVEWLMGFPEGWTDLSAWATP